MSVLPEKEQIQKNNQLIIPSVQNICPIFGTELDYVSSNDNGLTSRFLQPENAFTILNRSKIPKVCIIFIRYYLVFNMLYNL